MQQEAEELAVLASVMRSIGSAYWHLCKKSLLYSSVLFALDARSQYSDVVAINGRDPFPERPVFGRLFGTRDLFVAMEHLRHRRFLDREATERGMDVRLRFGAILSVLEPRYKHMITFTLAENRRIGHDVGDICELTYTATVRTLTKNVYPQFFPVGIADYLRELVLREVNAQLGERAA